MWPASIVTAVPVIFADSSEQRYATKPATCKGKKQLVGKQSPCLLSFVYTSYIRYGVRATPKFGNHASLLLYYKDKKYV